MSFLPSAGDILLIFPAFLIGAAFGALVGLVLLGEGISANQIWRTIRLGAAGSAVGVLIFAATFRWWPEIIGPFLACPIASLAVVVLFPKRKDVQER